MPARCEHRTRCGKPATVEVTVIDEETDEETGSKTLCEEHASSAAPEEGFNLRFDQL